MKKWDVYLANVQFEDIPQAKVRPVIILGRTEVLIDCLKMTGQAPRQGEYVLQRWKDAGLHKPTTVRLSKRLALASKCMIKRIGALNPADIIEIQKRIT